MITNERQNHRETATRKVWKDLKR